MDATLVPVRSAQVGPHRVSSSEPFLIAGPCVLESRDLAFEVASTLSRIASERSLRWIFKSSFDKANRSSVAGTRGPGIEAGLALLAEVKREFKVPILTDVHGPEQCAQAATVADVLQIPAFLCRQTDLLVAAAKTGRTVNVKKGQFLAPWDLQHAAKKCTQTGNPNVMLTERGTSFGYGRLVVDMNSFAHLAKCGHPVVFDATHSVQEPGAMGTSTGGDRRQVPALARAAAATGWVDGYFFEVHPDPDRAPSDGPNMVELAHFSAILDGVLAVHRQVRALAGA